LNIYIAPLQENYSEANDWNDVDFSLYIYLLT